MTMDNILSRAAIVAALALTAGQASPRELAWHEQYLQGVRLVEDGRGAPARALLEKALLTRPTAGLQVPTEGVRFIDYLPHLYLAAACHMSGDVAAARRHLAIADQEGVEARSAAGQSLLGTYRLLLGASPAPPVAPPVPGVADGEVPRYRTFARKPPTLPAHEYTALRRTVLSRCNLTEGDSKRAPWYFHYELGRDLIDAGDPQRALDAFLEAATLRASPQRNARTYGMWHTDYRPYFQIARAHARLENWDCARDALTVSEREAEISPEDKEFAELRQLVTETEKKLGR